MKLKEWELHPSIDNFASFLSKKLWMICSLVEYVNTINVEALVINWTGKYASVTQTFMLSSDVEVAN